MRELGLEPKCAALVGPWVTVSTNFSAESKEPFVTFCDTLTPLSNIEFPINSPDTHPRGLRWVVWQLPASCKQDFI